MHDRDNPHVLFRFIVRRRMDRSLSQSFSDAAYLTFNFAASVGIIFINKAIFESFQFKHTTVLTALHYLITLAGLEVLALGASRRHRDRDRDPQVAGDLELRAEALAVRRHRHHVEKQHRRSRDTNTDRTIPEC